MSDSSGETSTEVFLPEAVRRASARADELMAQQYVSDVPVEESAEPEASPSEPEQPLAELPAAADSWEQRYRTLQGKYDSEVPGLRSQIAGLERLLATMQQQPPVPEVAAPTTQAPLEFSAEDRDLYGDDLLHAMARTAEARYQPIIAQLEAKLNRLEGGQQSLAGARVQDQVFHALDQDPELAGRWDRINTSSDFKIWLQGIDPFSGVTRNEMLQHAYHSGDAIRTGRFFKAYMAEHNEHTVTPPIATPTQTVPAPVRNGHAAPAGSPRLEDFAAPGRAAGSGAQGGNGAPTTRTWSRPEIAAFYRDRTRGVFRGREEESRRLEESIFAANREGRVQ